MYFNRYYAEVITKNHTNINGRMRRKEYWTFFLFNVLISLGRRKKNKPIRS